MEYPKQMRHHVRGEVMVYGPPDFEGDQPYRYTDSQGREAWAFSHELLPLPSPDDEVEVVVRMTRAQRDYIAGTVPVMSRDRWSPVVGACRAHRDAEQAEGGTE